MAEVCYRYVFETNQSEDTKVQIKQSSVKEKQLALLKQDKLVGSMQNFVQLVNNFRLIDGRDLPKSPLPTSPRNKNQNGRRSIGKDSARSSSPSRYDRDNSILKEKDVSTNRGIGPFVLKKSVKYIPN